MVLISSQPNILTSCFRHQHPDDLRVGDPASTPPMIAAPAAGWHFRLPPSPGWNVAMPWCEAAVRGATMQGSLGQEVKDTTSSWNCKENLLGPIIMASQLLRSSSWALLLPGRVGEALISAASVSQLSSGEECHCPPPCLTRTLLRQSLWKPQEGGPCKYVVNADYAIRGLGAH